MNKEKQRNKTYLLRDLDIGDRFHLQGSKTVYQVIDNIRNRSGSVHRFLILNSETKKDRLKDPQTSVIFLRNINDK